MEFRILGPLELWHSGQLIRRGGPRQSGVLAMLLMRAPQAVPIAHLVDGVWGQSPPPAVRNQIQVHVSALRRLLAAHGEPSIISTDASGYSMRFVPAALDLRLFEEMTTAGVRALAAGQVAQAAELYHSALVLWRGPVLAGVPGRFVEVEAARLEERRMAVLQVRIAVDLALGRAASVVPELVELVESHPFHEGLQARLIAALHETGRAAEALEAYQKARRVLAGELGIEPGQELRALQRMVLQRAPAQPFLDSWLNQQL